MHYCPIVYFVFNRPRHTKQSLEALIKNPESSNSDLHVFVDGPRNHDDQEKINQVIDIVHSYKSYFKSFTIKENPSHHLSCVNTLCI